MLNNLDRLVPLVGDNLVIPLERIPALPNNRGALAVRDGRTFTTPGRQLSTEP